MLIVTIEYAPGGDRSRKRKLGELLICNAGTHTGERFFDYEAILERPLPDVRPECTWRRATGEVLGYERGQVPWVLVHKALDAVLPKIAPPGTLAIPDAFHEDVPTGNPSPSTKDRATFEEAMKTWSFESATRTGKLCAECGEPQVESPCGVVCVNGHGGADSVDPVKE